MAIEDDVFLELVVAKTRRNRAYWIERANLADQPEALAHSADVLILPWEKYREDRDLFPEETTRFTHFLREQLAGKILALAITEDEYHEIHLHGDEHRLGNTEQCRRG